MHRTFISRGQRLTFGRDWDPVGRIVVNRAKKISLSVSPPRKKTKMKKHPSKHPNGWVVQKKIHRRLGPRWHVALWQSGREILSAQPRGYAKKASALAAGRRGWLSSTASIAIIP